MNRNLVLQALDAIIHQHRYSNLVIKNDIQSITKRQEKDWYVYHVYGVIENLIFCDWVISQYAHIKQSKIHPKVLNILRLAVFQLFYSDTSDKTILFESVEITKKQLFKSQGFVNGILRKISREKDRIIESIEKLEPPQKISIQYSFPISFVNQLQKQWEYDEIIAYCLASNSRPELVLRINHQLIDRDTFLEQSYFDPKLLEKTKYAKSGLKLLNPHQFDQTDAYQLGLITPQDESSMLVTEILNPQSGKRLIDLCCAPGGKTLHASEWTKGNTHIIGCDIYEHKLKLVEQQIERLKLNNVKLMIQDSTLFESQFESQFDYAIADVPCSNSGIIRRKPEVKYKESLNSLKAIQKIQYQILTNASKYVKRGGRLIYSTCSVFDDENINQIERFLGENSGYRLISFEINDIIYPGYIQLLPHIHETDGFFIAYIERVL